MKIFSKVWEYSQSVFYEKGVNMGAHLSLVFGVRLHTLFNDKPQPQGNIGNRRWVTPGGYLTLRVVHTKFKDGQSHALIDKKRVAQRLIFSEIVTDNPPEFLRPRKHSASFP